MLKHNLVTVGDSANITVLVDGELLTASDTHPNFKAIVAAVLEGQEDVAHLFDMEKAISHKFQRLSERVSVRYGKVFFDGEEVNNSLTNHIIRFMDAGVEDFKPLVAFMEKIMVNPNLNSQAQLYEWLTNHDFTITDAGDIVAYKGCNVNAEGVPISTVSAPESDQVTVNGEPVTGYVQNPDGAVVEMPRHIVDNDEDVHCSVGLHVGTYRYASNYASGAVLEVHVNPRDVVSVTSDSNREKIRCCRYTVVGPVKQAYSAPVIATVPVTEEQPECDDFCESYGCDCDEGTVVSELEALVEKVDTRLNHLKQQRYPKGHPKAGQFIPKGQ